MMNLTRTITKATESLTSISQGLAPRWSAGLSYSYTDAKYDISQNFTSQSGGLNLGYTQSVQDSFSAGVNYSDKNYDEVEISEIPEIPNIYSDYYTVRFNLGWTHAFSPHKTLSVSAGPAYLNYVDQDDYWTQYFDIIYTSQFKNGSWFVEANGGFDDRAFDGLNQGVSEYQRAGTGVSWQVAKDVSASLGASMRNDGFLQNPLTSDEKTYNAYANLSYRFWRWFYVSGRYWYVNVVDSDINANDREEHRFFITLGASRELYRWIH